MCSDRETKILTHFKVSESVPNETSTVAACDKLDGWPPSYAPQSVVRGPCFDQYKNTIRIKVIDRCRSLECGEVPAPANR